MRPTIRKLLVRVLWGLGIFLLLVMLAFEALPLLSNTALGTFRLMTRQRVLEQRIVKNVMVLAYRTDQDEHAEAISELQTTLPVWEKVQKGLQDGDPSLSLSPNLPSDLKLLLTQAQPDFVYLDTAAHQILTHPSPVDQAQVLIVLQHDQPYYLTMAQANDLLQERLQNAAKIYFSIELGIGITLMSLWIVFLFSFHALEKRSKS